MLQSGLALQEGASDPGLPAPWARLYYLGEGVGERRMLEEGGGSTPWGKRVHGGGEEGAWMLEREHMLDEGRKPPQ